MELREAINGRRSIRGFTSQPVARETLREVLNLATRAVSSINCQPWEFVVATGAVLDALKERNMEMLRNGEPEDRKDAEVPDGPYKDRGRTIGKALLSAMNITREDKEGRVWWNERGYRFFDAPAVIFLLMDESLDETAYRFDMGCVAQNICLAALEQGLGTCVEDQAVTYQKGARELLNIPESKRFVIGIAIGYPDQEFPANNVVSTREDIDQITSWHGFE
jgi:nitroreductase